jgi:hypothetical protein
MITIVQETKISGTLCHETATENDSPCWRWTRTDPLALINFGSFFKVNQPAGCLQVIIILVFRIHCLRPILVFTLNSIDGFLLLLIIIIDAFMMQTPGLISNHPDTINPEL